MTALAITLIVLTAVVLGIWASRHVMIAKEGGGFVLTEQYRGDGELPPVSVVVAAKDEQENIGRCATTMLEQDYGELEMIVVNDRSTDGTASIVQRIAEKDRRLRLINVGHLPAGWCGKNHAMQTGIAAARSEWICMIDADCHQTSRRSLTAAVAYAQDSGADLLSVLPNLEMKGFWESAVQPVCAGVMMIWFNPAKVNDPARPQAYANGAFMLMRRPAYEAVGGHAAVRDKLNEDMHLAARTKQQGLKLRVVRNNGLYLVRMYSSLREIVAGWSRIFYGTFGTRRRLSISLAVLMVMALLPYAAAALGWSAWAAGARPAGLLLACGLLGAAAAAVQISVIYRFYRLIGARAEMAWSYPIGCLAAIVALLVALIKSRPGARFTWRSTTYTNPKPPA
ncbi:MAG: hypothetical protein AMJ81_02150 [Phycisphaerae bacterium SM23_33]|nr:MAG: hypothetical protein AMJ81_02150 [Phycisphaerae bacterium SM23_33]